MLNYAKLKAQYGTTELDQILSELWISTGYVIGRLETLSQHIHELKLALETSKSDKTAEKTNQ